MSDGAEEGGEACRWCGDRHGPRCPWVKALNFGELRDSVTRVEFFSPVELWGPQRPAEPEPGDYPRKPSS